MSAILKFPNLECDFRLMRESDLDEVIAIEESVYPYPWTRGIFYDCLHVGYLCRVLENVEHNKIIAYSVMSAAVEEAHLLTIAIIENEQCKGYGKWMLEEMIRLAKVNLANTLYLEVRSSNAKAIQLYHQRGFNELGIRKGYYPDEKGREDALLFALDLSFLSFAE